MTRERDRKHRPPSSTPSESSGDSGSESAVSTDAEVRRLQRQAQEAEKALAAIEARKAEKAEKAERKREREARAEQKKAKRQRSPVSRAEGRDRMEEAGRAEMEAGRKAAKAARGPSGSRVEPFIVDDDEMSGPERKLPAAVLPGARRAEQVSAIGRRSEHGADPPVVHGVHCRRRVLPRPGEPPGRPLLLPVQEAENQVPAAGRGGGGEGGGEGSAEGRAEGGAEARLAECGARLQERWHGRRCAGRTGTACADRVGGGVGLQPRRLPGRRGVGGG